VTSPQIKYVKAPHSWSYTHPNPYSEDGRYGHAWSAFCIEDRGDAQVVTGRHGDGPFCARFGRGVVDLQNRLADFLRYECAHDRTVILSCPEDFDVDRFVSRALSRTPASDVVRQDDPKTIVHSTTRQAWLRIEADRALRAASQLAADEHAAYTEQQTDSEVARYYHDEPFEYADYIMFAKIDEVGPEMVVASRAAGRFVLDPDAVYQPGVRLYFDNDRLIRDGWATRDGLHTMKVLRYLPLDPYLLKAVSLDDVDPDGALGPWTMRAFLERANAEVDSRQAAHCEEREGEIHRWV
jgi:hypothetical protein